MPANLKLQLLVDDKGSVVVKEFGQTAQRSMKASADSTGPFMDKLGVLKTGILAVGAAFGAWKIYDIGKDLIKTASDLEEVSSKFNVVFSGQEEAAARWADTLVGSYAMSTRESRQYLSSVQDLLVPMGMQAKAAGRLSFEIVKLSADLGSFNNMPTARVMDDIQSALVGNYETMKKYGVVLNATVVQEKALAMGLADTKDALTASHKAQAAYKLMVEGSAAAIGDMARTSGSYANQMKQLSANIEDIKVLLGEELLPYATEIITEMNKWIKANKDFMKTDVVGFIDTIRFAIEKLLWPLKVWRGIWQEIGWIASGFKGEMPRGPEVSAGTTAGAVMGTELSPASKGPEPEKGATGSEAIRTSYEDQLAAYWEGESMKTELLELSINQRQEMARAAMEADLEAIKMRNMAEIEEEIARADQIQRIDDAIAMNKKRAAQLQLSIASNLASAALMIAGVSGKKLFMIQKAVDVGMAIMSAYKASAMALAHPPGPPTTIPLSEMVLKIGLLNAAAIAATAVGQMAASSGGYTGGGTYTSPTVTTPAGGEEYVAPTEEGQRGTLTINIQGDFIGDEGYIEMLAEKISEAVEDKDVTLIASNAQYAESLI